MKPFILLLMAISVNSQVFSSKNQTSYPEEKQSIKRLKEFYTAYVTEWCKIPEDFSKIDSILKEYCTDELLKQMNDEDIDYDILLDGQDFDEAWLKTMTISKDKIQKNVYIVGFDYKFMDTKKKKIIKLEVIKQGTAIKINKVLIKKY